MSTDIRKIFNIKKVEIKSCNRYEYCILKVRVSNDTVTRNGKLKISVTYFMKRRKSRQRDIIRK